MMTEYRRRIQFYETDAMGIVHHAIYLHLFEEARTDLMRTQGLLGEDRLEKINFPVLECQVNYKKPLYYDDVVEIVVRLKSDRVRLYFDYELSTKRYPEVAAFGKTVHVAMDMVNRKPQRLPDPLANLS